jgi:hypothetical protein
VSKLKKISNASFAWVLSMSRLFAANHVLFAKSVWISICYRKIIKNASCAEIKFQKKIQNIIREEIVLKSFVQTLNVLILAKK